MKILENISLKFKSSDVVITTYGSMKVLEVKQLITNAKWERCCLDEMQEIRSATSVIAKQCEGLQCDRRWMISGTPLFEGIHDLKGELNFLRVEPFSANSEDGFWKFLIQNHYDAKTNVFIETMRYLNDIVLRRSKDMTFLDGTPILGLPQKTVLYVPVAQTHSERALYNWLEYMVADALKDKISTVTEDENYGGGVDERKRVAARQQTMGLVRLLRDLTISPVLISGGLGIKTDALKRIQQLCAAFNQKNEIGWKQGRAAVGGRAELTPTEALNYISHMRSSADSSGTTGGATSRNRAVDDPHCQLTNKLFDLLDSEGQVRVAQRKKAQAWWWFALDLITTGQHGGLEEEIREKVGVSIFNLWAARAARKEKDEEIKKLKSQVSTAKKDLKLLEKAKEKTKADIRKHEKYDAQCKVVRGYLGEISDFLLDIEKNVLKRSFAPHITEIDSLSLSPRLKMLDDYLNRGWRSTEFSIRLMLVAHEDWHWLRSSTLEFVNVPLTVTSSELADSLYAASLRTPQAMKDHEGSTANVAKAKAEMDAKMGDYESYRVYLHDHFGDGEKSLGVWDSSRNKKGWDSRSKKTLKKKIEAKNKAVTAHSKARDILSKRVKDIARAKEWDQLVAVKPTIVLKETSSQVRRGYAIFKCGRGDPQNMFWLQTKLTALANLTSDRKINHGVKVVTASPPPIIGKKIKDAEADVRELQTLVGVGAADESRLILAKSQMSIAKGGLRLKLSTDGIMNYPYPTPQDEGNIWLTKR